MRHKKLNEYFAEPLPGFQNEVFETNWYNLFESMCISLQIVAPVGTHGRIIDKLVAQSETRGMKRIQGPFLLNELQFEIRRYMPSGMKDVSPNFEEQLLPVWRMWARNNFVDLPTKFEQKLVRWREERATNT
ncbi:MAG: hypothetical protein ACK40M_04310 [Flavobacteriales bacterium]